MQNMMPRDFTEVRDALLKVIPDTEASLKGELSALSVPAWDPMLAPELNISNVHRATWVAEMEILGRYFPKNQSDCTSWQEEVVKILKGDVNNQKG